LQEEGFLCGKTFAEDKQKREISKKPKVSIVLLRFQTTKQN